MFERFLRMLKKYGNLAAYLMMKCETQTLTKDDVKLAKMASPTNESTMVRIIGGNLEEKPDLCFLALEGVNGIAFDLDLDKGEYMSKLGFWDSSSNVWDDEPKHSGRYSWKEDNESEHSGAESKTS